MKATEKRPTIGVTTNVRQNEKVGERQLVIIDTSFEKHITNKEKNIFIPSQSSLPLSGFVVTNIIIAAHNILHSTELVQYVKQVHSSMSYWYEHPRRGNTQDKLVAIRQVTDIFACFCAEQGFHHFCRLRTLSGACRLCHKFGMIFCFFSHQLCLRQS